MFSTCNNGWIGAEQGLSGGGFDDARFQSMAGAVGTAGDCGSVAGFAAGDGMTRYFVLFLRRSPERKPLAKEEAERSYSCGAESCQS